MTSNVFIGLKGVLPAWMKKAACAGVDPEIFYPHSAKEEAADLAREICWQCPVRTKCLDYATNVEPQAYGVWGGTTPYQRGWNNGKRRKGAQKCPRCNCYSLFRQFVQVGDEEICIPCICEQGCADCGRPMYMRGTGAVEAQSKVLYHSNGVCSTCVVRRRNGYNTDAHTCSRCNTVVHLRQLLQVDNKFVCTACVCASGCLECGRPMYSDANKRTVRVPRSILYGYKGLCHSCRRRQLRKEEKA